MEEHKDYKRLFEYMKSFPGIGKRQAERFVYHILTKDNFWVDGFVDEIKKAKTFVHECVDCFRIYKNPYNEKFEKCEICRSTLKDRTVLAVVEKNIDAESFLQKTSFNGLVFILGGNIPVIEKKNRGRVRLEELLKFVEKLAKENLSEVIICNSLNPDGIFTASVIHQKIREMVAENKIPEVKISTFGRGFSTGTELEYADRDTLLSALNNRSTNLF
jgi:recombination protein RecR